MAADWLFLFEAYAQIGVSLGMLINYCGPAIVIAASPIVLKEKISRAKVINTGLGCFFYFSSIGKLPAQTVAVCGYIEPLSAVLLSTIVLKERMLPLQFLGAALIIGGALFGEITVRESGKKN